jgi:predicted transcriptional regulator
MDIPDESDLRPKRLVNYAEWFLRKVDKDLAAGDRGEFVDHSDVRKMIDARYPG